MHVIQDGREDSAASAGRCRDDHFFRRILFADRVGIGRNQPVHGHIRAFIVASLFVQRLSLPKHSQAPGQGSFRFQPAFDRTAHGLPDLPQILAERRSFQDVDEPQDTDMLLIAQGDDLGKVLLRIDLLVFIGSFVFDPD